MKPAAISKAKAWPDGPLLFGHDDSVADFVKSHIAHMQGDFGSYVAIGVVRRQKLVAGIVYNEYRPEYGSIMVSMASDGSFWMTPSVLCSFFAYPFEQLRCNRIGLATPKRNKRSRKLAAGVGFKLEGCVRRGVLTDDLMIYGMLARECRWLGTNENEHIGSLASCGA